MYSHCYIVSFVFYQQSSKRYTPATISTLCLYLVIVGIGFIHWICGGENWMSLRFFGGLLVASTWRLWTPQTVFPQVPLSRFLLPVVAWLDVIGGLGLLAALVLPPRTSATAPPRTHCNTNAIEKVTFMVAFSTSWSY